MLNNAKVDGYELKLTNTDMKKYLFIALALFGMASCAKDDLNAGNKPHHNGEVEESYIAINLMAADVDSRAQDLDNEKDGGYEDGTPAERAVNSAYFFFFDENGNPFNVLGTPATAPGGGKNHLQLSITPMKEEDKDVNVSDISQAVLILNTYKGVYPKQVVAVLNWAPAPDKAYSLDDLHDELAEIGNDTKGYVMSNSVYMVGEGAEKEMIDAVKITEAHIKKEAGLAKENPIDIYVERIAAKVCVTTQAGASSMFKVTNNDTMLKPVGGSAKDVYMNVLGWELFNEYATSNLIKDIDISWTAENLGLTWNDSPYYRCYWATSQSTVIDDKFTWKYAHNGETYNGFPSEYGYAVGGHTYCGENTNSETLRTKLILKGQLMEKTAEDTYKELEIASWFGNEYAGEDDLKTAVVNSLTFTLLYKVDDDTYSSIGVDDIICVEGEELQEVNSKIKAYQVGFQLSDVAGKGNDRLWYLYSPDGQHKPLGNIDDLADVTAKTNEYLAKNVEPALLYKSGQTYYIVDIEHLGKDKAKPAYYGVVRNHVYQIDINSIKGFGSPIYSGLDFIVEQPEYPIEYEDSYVAARINVLSWKVVKQSVDIVQ